MNEKLDWLQALRGIAALMVLFFHLTPHWEQTPGLAFLAPAMKWGFSGVDIFFVLSGFVVHQSTRQLRFGAPLRKYALRRAARIYLTYWPALLVLMVCNHWFLNSPAPSLETTVRSVLLLAPSIFDNVLPVAWSLTYELYFYLLLGVVLLFPARLQGRLILLVITLVVVWNAGWLIARRDMIYGGGQPMRFWISGYIVEFMVGAFLSSLMLASTSVQSQPIRADNGPNWIAAGVCCAFLGLATGATSVFFDRVEIMRVASFGLIGLGGFLVAMALQRMNVRAPGFLVRIGDHSFGLYLIHAPLLGVFGTLRYRASLIDGTLSFVVSLLTPVAIVLIAAVWFKLLEAPAIRLTRRLH